jgi:hypothetical protein
MTHFAVYDIVTGAIRRHGSCMACDLARQADDGEAVIETEGAAPGDRFRVDVKGSPPVLTAITRP